MDAMEDMDSLSGSNTHLSKLSSDFNMAASKETFPGIKYSYVGKSGLKLSNITLGSIKTFGPGVDPETSDEIVTTAYEQGINHFEISDPYLSENAERVLGRILSRKDWPRRSYFVTTRVFWQNNDMVCLSRKEILESVKQSLANLQLEYVDLLIIHKFDPNCPLEELLRALTYLVDKGMIMYWGTARWSAFELFEAYAKAKEYGFVGPTCEVGEYHWFHREKVELYMAELYNKMGLGLMGWSPVSVGLAHGDNLDDVQGLLTKLLNKSLKYQQQPNNPRITTTDVLNTTFGAVASPCSNQIMGHTTVSPAGVFSNPPINKVKALTSIADRLGCNLVQLQVAWQVRNQTIQSTTFSATSKGQLMDLLNSLAIIPTINHAIMEEMEKILNNKPSRPPMISTLQQRWAATGGVPPPS